jgi:hypothetical protein
LRPAILLPAAALLLAACAAAEPDPTPPATPAVAGLVEDGPFRMRITSAYSSLDPDGKLTVSFETEMEAADGGPFPRDRWFFEYARIAEHPLLDGGAEGYQDDDTVSMPAGWSPKGYVMIQELPADTRVLRRLVIDRPMLEILEGLVEEIRLGPDESADRSIDALSCTFTAEGGGLVLGTGEDNDEFEGLPLRLGVRRDGFYGCDGRPVEHAWEITDATGRPFVEGPGFGTGGWQQQDYGPDPRFEGPLRHPIVIRWRVPRRWRATMQRFVFEDLAVPPPVPIGVPRPEDE